MTKTLVIVCFVVAFAAGLVVGLEARRASDPTTTRPSHHSGWLATELSLSPQQQEQLKTIWSETAERGGRGREDRRRQLYRQRDEAIAALIRPEDKSRYDQVLKDYSEQMSALDREWRASFESTVERTRQILTAKQQAKYDELLKHHQSERGPGDRHRGERGREPGSRGDHHGSSRPAARP
jgi:Spy/CpxP family protein refolding chaperone